MRILHRNIRVDCFTENGKPTIKFRTKSVEAVRSMFGVVYAMAAGGSLSLESSPLSCSHEATKTGVNSDAQFSPMQTFFSLSDLIILRIAA